MALTKDNILLAEEIKNLKAIIKKELARRKYVGTVAEYGSDSYDFSKTPVANNTKIDYDDIYKKTVDLLKKINAASFNNYTQSKNSIIKEFETLSNTLAVLESAGYTSSTHGCASSCTGLCTGSCATDCSGCSGSCTSCSGSCTGCTGCSGSCGGACSYGCGGSCS